MKVVMMTLGIILAIFGLVDLLGSFFGFDLWYEIGIELPDFLWKRSAYAEFVIAGLLYQTGKSMSVVAADDATQTAVSDPLVAQSESDRGLVYKHEQKLFLISAIFSAIFWLALIVLTVGIALIAIVLFALFSILAQSAFISFLQGTGVKIGQDQYPDLYQQLLSNCEKIGLSKVPDAYLLRADFFNALATRFLGRHFVVLFTDVVDSLSDQPSAVDFYIGHELGHIHREHVMWRIFLVPASVLPLLGAALRRAEEYTCDRYGAVCCASENDINAALAAMVAGDSRWKSINMDAYVRQTIETNGFWMSFNELLSDYPWLTKRAATSIFYRRGQQVQFPRRHIFAWILAAFVPRIGGGIMSLPLTFILVGFVAASAVPAYNDYTERTRLSAIYLSAQTVQDKVSEYVIENQQWPNSLNDMGIAEPTLTVQNQLYEMLIYEDGVVGVNVGTDKIIYLEPFVRDGILNWNCYGENIPSQQMPSGCN